MKDKTSGRHPRIQRAILATALSGAITFVRAAEPRPKSLFPDTAPVCPCESLAKVSLPNTTIDSAAIEDEDCGIFWSNDPRITIGEMARAIGVLELEEEMARVKEFYRRAGVGRQ